MLILELDGDLAAVVAADVGDAGGRRRRAGPRGEERAHPQHDAHWLQGGGGGGGARHRREVDAVHGTGRGVDRDEARFWVTSGSWTLLGGAKKTVTVVKLPGKRFEFEHGRRV